MTRWTLLLLVISLPTLVSALALAAHERTARVRGPWLALPAGPWLEGIVRRLGLAVPIEVQPAGTPDAYWPNTGAIGLSARTWGSCRAGAFAIAAHELGHALTASRPLLGTILPAARLASGLAWRTFAAAAVVALLGTPEALPLALLALVGSVLAAGLVCADEVLASRTALRLLEADPRLRRGLPHARVAVAGAGAAYVLEAAARLGVLLAWPAVARLASGAPTLPTAPSTAALWWLVGLLPFLAVRTLHGLRQVVDPEPVDSDLQLASVAHREAVLELGTGAGIAVLVLGVHATSSDAPFVVALVLALAAALGPLAGLARVVLAAPFAAPRDARDVGFPPLGRGQDLPPALMALWSDPPWYVRTGWLASLGYLPLLVALAQALTRS